MASTESESEKGRFAHRYYSTGEIYFDLLQCGGLYTDLNIYSTLLGDGAGYFTPQTRCDSAGTWFIFEGDTGGRTQTTITAHQRQGWPSCLF